MSALFTSGKRGENHATAPIPLEIRRLCGNRNCGYNALVSFNEEPATRRQLFVFPVVFTDFQDCGDCAGIDGTHGKAE
jgi:hypothetical protein